MQRCGGLYYKLLKYSVEAGRIFSKLMNNFLIFR